MTALSNGRVHPSLLDRLIDEHPTSHVEEAGASWGMSIEQWHAAVVRDLHRLIDTPSTYSGSVRQALLGSRSAPLETLPIELLEHLAPAFASTVNYGVPPIAGTLMGPEQVEHLSESLRIAIERFEPRLVPGTVSVSPIESEHDWNYGIVVGFRIEAEIGPDPVSLSLRMRTVVDAAAGLLRADPDGPDRVASDSAS